MPYRVHPQLLLLLAVLCLIPASVSSASAQEGGEDPWTSRTVLTLPEATPPLLDFAFDADLASVFLLVGDPNKQRVLKNGVPVDPPGLSLFADLRNASTGNAWSMMAIDADGAYAGGQAFHRGELVAEAAWVGVPQASADGKVLAYWKSEDARYERATGYAGGDFVLMFGGKEIAIQKGWPGTQFALSPDGKKLAYVTERKRLQATLHLGKKELAKAQFISHVQWSANSSKVAYQTGSGSIDKSQVHLHGKLASEDYASAAVPVLGPKGKKLAFLFREGDKVGVVAGKKAWKGRWDVVSPPVWSPKAKSLAVIVNEGPDPILKGANDFGAVWFDKPYAFLVDRETGGFRLAERQGTFQLVVDDEPLGATYLNASSPTWGPKGKRIAFRAESVDGWHVVVDGTESEAYDRVTAPVFHPQDGRVGFGALRGQEVLWVVFEPNDEP